MTRSERDGLPPHRCSLCGLEKAGGVAGPTLEVYICQECIRLAAEIVELQEAVGGTSADRG